MRHINLFFVLSLLAAPAVATGAPVAVRYVDIGDQGQSKYLAADSSGNLFVVSQFVAPSGRDAIRVTKTDAEGNTLASFDVPESVSAYVTGAAPDPQGNVVIAVSLNPSANFVVKIDSQLTQVLLSTQVSGALALNALTVDPAGNIIVAGVGAPPSNSTAYSYAFMTELSPDGKHVIFSTTFGSDQTTCSPYAPPCHARTAATNVAIDSTGAVIMAGSSDSSSLPVTSGAYAQQCGCSSGHPAGFVAKFAPAGASLMWATYLPVIDPDYFSISAMALAQDGSVIVGGFGGETGPPTTPGVVQPMPPEGYLSGFVLELDPTGSRLVFSTAMGGQVGSPELVDGVTSLATDSQGNIWATGGSIPSLLPLPAGTPLLGATFTVALSSDGTRITHAFTAPQGAAGQAVLVTQAGEVVTLGANGSLIVGISDSGPFLAGVTNSAGLHVSGYVAPYEVVSLYGVGLGPAQPMNAQVVNGNVSTSLGGIQVLFDGGPVPLLYAGPNQIEALVPPFYNGEDTTVLQVVTASGTTPGTTLQLRPSQPEVFRNSTPDVGGIYAASALNQDGTVNSASNPAARGSIVSIWATGAGSPAPVAPSWGSIVSNLLSVPLLPVSVLMGTNQPLVFGIGNSLEVLYAGDAPGLITGMTQINFQVPLKPAFDPATYTDGPEMVCTIQVGEESSGPFGIYIQ